MDSPWGVVLGIGGEERPHDANKGRGSHMEHGGVGGASFGAIASPSRVISCDASRPVPAVGLPSHLRNDMGGGWKGGLNRPWPYVAKGV